MTKKLWAYWTFLMLIGSPLAAQTMPMGDFSLDSLFFHPRLEYSEAQRAQFNTDLWGVKGSWTLPPSLSVHLLAGSSALTTPMSFYETPERKSLDLAEYYAQYRWDGVTLQAGQVKLPVGFWGGRAAIEHTFSRSIVYQKGLVGVRDHGLAFESVFGGFKNRWVVHSGESGPDSDREWSFSGQWQFQDSEGFLLGLTGQVGRVGPYDPTVSTSRLAGYTPGSAVHHRLGNLYVGWLKPSSMWLLEGYWGSWTQENEDHQFFNYIFEVSQMMSPSLPLFLRVDHWDVRHWAAAEDETQWTVGAGWMSPHQNSLVLLMLRVQQLEGQDPQHSALLSWRLRSKSPHPLTRML